MVVMGFRRIALAQGFLAAAAGPHGAPPWRGEVLLDDLAEPPENVPADRPSLERRGFAARPLYE